MFKKLLFVTLVASFPTLSFAKTNTQFGLYAGYTKGKEEVDIPFTDGTTSALNYGGKFALGISARSIFNKMLLAKVNAGYHIDWVKGGNGETHFGRYTVDALVGLRPHKNISLYGGVTYHIKPKDIFEHDDHPTRTKTHQDTLGYVAELSLNVRNEAELIFRYVDIKYQYDQLIINGEPSYDISFLESLDIERDGSHFGIYFTRYF